VYVAMGSVALPTEKQVGSQQVIGRQAPMPVRITAGRLPGKTWLLAPDPADPAGMQVGLAKQIPVTSRCPS
jgi:hypothetical protein